MAASAGLADGRHVVGAQVRNRHDGRVIRITRVGIQKAASGSGPDILRAMPAIPQMLREGIHLVEQPDAQGRHNVKAIHIYASAVEIAGRRIDILLTVREMTDGNLFYDLARLPDGGSAAPSGGTRLDRAPAGSGRPAISDINIAIAAHTRNRNAQNDRVTLEIAPGVVAEYELTAEAAARAEEMLAAVEAIVARKAPAGARVGLASGLSYEGEVGTGIHVPALRLIAVAIRTLDGSRFRTAAEIRNTVNHEVVHDLRRFGLFRSNEWAALKNRAIGQWMAKFDIKARYPGESFEVQIEEAIAEAFADWAGGNRRGVTGPALSSFRRIAEVLRAVVSWLQGNGFMTPDAIFQRVESGEMAQGGRDNSTSTAAQTRPPDADGRALASPETAPKGAVSVSGDRTRTQGPSDREDMLTRPQGVRAPIEHRAIAGPPGEPVSVGDEARLQAPRSGPTAAKRALRGRRSGKKTASKGASLKRKRREGLEAEAGVGAPKEKTRVPVKRNGNFIDGATGAADFRFPDIYDPARAVIGEVKFVRYQHLSRQLIDYLAIAQHERLTFELHLWSGAACSKQLQRLINRGRIVLRQFDMEGRKAGGRRPPCQPRPPPAAR